MLLAIRWKKITLTTLLHEVGADEHHATGLTAFSENVRARAEQHLRLKLSRLERRAGSVLGDKTAVLSLLALTMPFMKEAGGLSWIRGVMDSSYSYASWESLLFYFFVFLFGASLGAIGLKMLAERIRYQLEILSLVRAKSQITDSTCYEKKAANVSSTKAS
ncbi:MAG: hypothetical protein IH587_11345 [Anaerolineae bacterium]|nr:hypothetical protein [Anaerolineae bacterium]